MQAKKFPVYIKDRKTVNPKELYSRHFVIITQQWIQSFAVWALSACHSVCNEYDFSFIFSNISSST